MYRNLGILLLVGLASGSMGCSSTPETVSESSMGNVIVSSENKVVKPESFSKPSGWSRSEKVQSFFEDCRPEPKWTSGPGLAKYPVGKYLGGSGSGPTARAAIMDALDEIGKTIQVKITSLSVDYSTEAGSLAERYITTETNQVLDGFEQVESKYDKCRKLYYVYMAARRDVMINAAKNRLKELANGLRHLMVRSEESVNKGQIIPALTDLMEGFDQAGTFLARNIGLQVIQRQAKPLPPAVFEITANRFKERMETIVRNIKFKKVSGDRQTVKLHRKPKDPLVGKLVLEKGGADIVLGNLPLIFKYEKGVGNSEASEKTNDKGLAQALVHEVKDFSDDHHEIRLQLDFDQLITHFKSPHAERLLKPLSRVSTLFTYTIKKINFPGTGKPELYIQSLVDIVQKSLSGMDENSHPKLAILSVLDLGEKDSPRKSRYSKTLKHELEAILDSLDGITLYEVEVPNGSTVSPAQIAIEKGLDMYMEVEHELAANGLWIDTTMLFSNPQDPSIRIRGGGANQTIPLEHIVSRDREDMENEISTPNLPIAHKKETLLKNQWNKLLHAKPGGFGSDLKIEVWPGRENKEYEIGDTITLYIKANRDCYITIFNLDSTGEGSVLVPNGHNRNTFIRAGVTYAVPGPAFNGFNLTMKGPKGEEQIKVIATLTPDELPLNLDFSNIFHSFKNDEVSSEKVIDRAIGVVKDKVESIKGVWGETYLKVFVFERGNSYSRGFRKPQVRRPQKPIDMIGTSGNEQNPQ